MNASIKKEMRCLLPGFAITVISTTSACLIFSGPAATAFVTLLFLPLSWFIGACSLGSEFQAGTMGVLLVQPRRRRGIWLEKMGVLGGTLFLALAIALLGMCFLIRENGEPSRAFEAGIGMAANSFVVFCATPFLTLITKNIFASMLFTWALPAAVWVLLLVGDWIVWKALSLSKPFLLDGVDESAYPYLAGIGIVCCGSCYWLGYRRFVKFESIESQKPWGEISLPGKLQARVGNHVKRFVPGYRGPLSSLARKELQLHQGSFIFAGFTLGLLVCEAAVCKLSGSEVAQGILIGTFVLYLFFIPVATAVTCIAEERNMATSGWQFSLPPSAAMQGRIKLLSALAICLTLGVVGPRVVWMAGQLWIAIPTSGWELDWLEVVHYYALGFSLSIFASSISKNGIQATMASFGILAGIGAIGG